MKRGEVYWANLAPRSGSEQAGRSPVIILSHDAFNQTSGWRSIIVIPVSTSAQRAKRGPTAIAIPAGTTGLPDDSIAICHQITTLDSAKLDDCLGTLPGNLLSRIEKGALAALDISIQ
jgi:mRNA interferase MazF